MSTDATIILGILAVVLAGRYVWLRELQRAHVCGFNNGVQHAITLLNEGAIRLQQQSMPPSEGSVGGDGPNPTNDPDWWKRGGRG
jgi:hypothetical protein